jgi:hypothetical protein
LAASQEGLSSVKSVSQAVQPEGKYQLEYIDIYVDESKTGKIIPVTGRGGFLYRSHYFFFYALYF